MNTIVRTRLRERLTQLEEWDAAEKSESQKRIDSEDYGDGGDPHEAYEAFLALLSPQAQLAALRSSFQENNQAICVPEASQSGAPKARKSGRKPMDYMALLEAVEAFERERYTRLQMLKPLAEKGFRYASEKSLNSAINIAKKRRANFNH